MTDRHAEGAAGKGVLAALSTAAIDGERGLTIEGQVSVVMVLSLAGLDTTRGGRSTSTRRSPQRQGSLCEEAARESWPLAERTP